MKGHISLWRLARELGTYPDLIAALCRFNEIRVVAGPRGRMLRDSDAHLAWCMLHAYRSRPTLNFMLGRSPRRKPKAQRTRRRKERPRPILRIRRPA